MDKTQPEDRIHIKARLVRFSWQRGVKIGKDEVTVKIYHSIVQGKVLLEKYTLPSIMKQET